MAEAALEKQSLREVPASEILAKIEKSKPVEYNHADIMGDLDISEIESAKVNIDFIVISPIKITNSTFKGSVKFLGCLFRETVDFKGTLFGCHSSFNYASFEKGVNFANTYFGGGSFLGAKFKGIADFSGTQFRRGNFHYAKFNENVKFYNAQFIEYVDFYGAIFDGRANFHDARLNGEDAGNAFSKMKFKQPKDEEFFCRKAKKLLDKQGNKKEADELFYKEMSAKRKQKPGYIRYPELALVQLLFGYGVHPERLLISWGAIVIIFFLIYQFGCGIAIPDGWFGWLKFSFGAAIAPGYIASISSPGSIGYNLSPLLQVVAMIEAVAGTFLWAGFIATFARKYMR